MAGKPRIVTTRTCQDCPTQIPANGGRKRCPECQDVESDRVRKARYDAKRAAKPEGANAAA